jgi:hypothetical protein
MPFVKAMFAIVLPTDPDLFFFLSVFISANPRPNWWRFAVKSKFNVIKNKILAMPLVIDKKYFYCIVFCSLPVRGLSSTNLILNSILYTT